MIHTIVRYVGGKDLWESSLPPLLKGHRVNVGGESMKVMDSAITLVGRHPRDSEFGVSQLIVVEKSRD